MESEVEIVTAIADLDASIERLCAFFEESRDFSIPVNTLWSAKDVLGHLVFWHESFAKNITAVATGLKPDLLKGNLPEINAQSVATTKRVSIPTLCARMRKAQMEIKKHILNPAIEHIPYRQRSRKYGRLEHVKMVENHIGRHLKSLRKKLNVSE